MREQLERRLEELKKEFSTGRNKSAELEQQQTTLHQTLLRISGAIQVLEEELKAAPSQESDPIGDAAHADPSRINGFLDRVAR
jgi:cell division septum initiation protein DivIVA